MPWGDSTLRSASFPCVVSMNGFGYWQPMQHSLGMVIQLGCLSEVWAT